jgi:hypothetical protein
MASLHDALLALPIYGDYECSDSDCSQPACIRHPMSGKFYCSGHAAHLAESHRIEMEDISMMIRIRQSMLDEEVACDLCDKPAERICNYCGTPICFAHYHLIPRTGACCDACADELEQEAEALERS